MPAWNAYHCPNINHEMLIIESMDSDSSTRRITPMTMTSNGYVDLINGPMDHTW